MKGVEQQPQPTPARQHEQTRSQKDKCVGDLYVCVCVWWGVVFFIIILLGEADKTHLIVLCYYVTKTGLVGAAALLPTFHTYLGETRPQTALRLSVAVETSDHRPHKSLHFNIHVAGPGINPPHVDTIRVKKLLGQFL